MPRVHIPMSEYINADTARVLEAVCEAVLDRLGTGNGNAAAPVFSQGGGYFISDTGQQDSYVNKPFRALITDSAVQVNPDTTQSVTLYSWVAEVSQDYGSYNKVTDHGNPDAWIDDIGGLSGSVGETVNITAISNTTPVVVTTDPNHFATGTPVTLAGTGIPALEGTWIADVQSATQFALVGSTAQGVGAAGTATTPRACPAFEANNNPVADGTVVQMRRAYLDETYEWVYVFDTVPLEGVIPGPVIFSGTITFDSTTVVTIQSGSAWTFAATSTISFSSTVTVAGGTWTFPTTSNPAVAPAARLIIPKSSAGFPTYTATISEVICAGKDLAQGSSTGPFTGGWEKYIPVSATPVATSITYVDGNGRIVPTSTAITYTPGTNTIVVPGITSSTSTTTINPTTTATVQINSVAKITQTATTTTINPTTTFVTQINGTDKITQTATATTITTPLTLTATSITVGTYYILTEGSAISITTNTDDLTIPTTSLVKITTSGGSYNLTSIVKPTGPVATTIKLIKTDTGTLTITNNSGGTADNRLISVTGANIALTQYQGVEITYVTSLNRWIAVPLKGGTSPLTTKGDIYVYSTMDTRLPVGANDLPLVADSGQSTGLTYKVLPLAGGGTGQALSNPGADRILFWDDSAGVVTWLTAGSGLSISGTTITSTGSAAGSDKQVQINNSGSLGTNTWEINSVSSDAQLSANPGSIIVTGTNGAIVELCTQSPDTAGRFVRGTDEVWLCKTYTVDVNSGYVNVPGTTGNTYRWSNGSVAPATNAGTPTTRYGGDTNYCGDPDAWLLVSIAGADYVIPAFAS